MSGTTTGGEKAGGIRKLFRIALWLGAVLLGGVGGQYKDSVIKPAETSADSAFLTTKITLLEHDLRDAKTAILSSDQRHEINYSRLNDKMDVLLREVQEIRLRLPKPYARELFKRREHDQQGG